jgi:hypothetical protein
MKKAPSARKKSAAWELAPAQKVPHQAGNLPPGPYVGTSGQAWGHVGLTRCGLFGPTKDWLVGHMTQQWDTTVSNEEKPNEKSRAIRARQRAIGRELRRMYDDVAQEAVPDEFLDLLKKIDQVAEGKKS